MFAIIGLLACLLGSAVAISVIYDLAEKTTLNAHISHRTLIKFSLWQDTNDHSVKADCASIVKVRKGIKQLRLIWN